LKAARRYIVKGRVQGVGYRWFVKGSADKLGLRGYARNLDDGSVEVVAVGPMKQIEDLLAALQQGPGLADVKDVEHAEHPAREFRSFEIR
jgi:acylphosphatase